LLGETLTAPMLFGLMLILGGIVISRRGQTK